MTLAVVPIPVAAEIRPGDELAALILADAPALEDGDVVVVTHKAVAKAEGRIVRLADVEPSARALRLTAPGADARHVEIVLRESRRVVRRRAELLICETHHGFVCANAGVDRSNAPEPDSVTLLPVDPDASARRLREALEQGTGRALGVVVADTFGRAWRQGLVGTAIGISGLEAVQDLRGVRDPNGYELRGTAVAVADELAAAADLVLGKTARVPAALVRGFALGRRDGSAQDLVRPADEDLFR